MCGIVGIVRRDSPITEGDRRGIECVLDILRHRGPDGRGVWEKCGAILGHTRLSIVDLSEAGRQPFVSAESGIGLTFNGEIYNHKELRAELQRDGRSFTSRTDTEVALYMYEKYGVSCFSKFRGMFAIALWDPSKKQLVLARDRAGEKPCTTG